MSYRTTRHAAERWQQRIDPQLSLHSAGRVMSKALETAVRIPNRRATDQWGTLGGKGRQHRREGLRYFYHPSALFLVSGGSVVTVLATGEDDLATILAWLLTGCWVRGEV